MTRKRTPFDYALWAALPMAHTSRIEGRITMILDKTQSRRILTRRVLLFALIPSAAALMTLAALRPTARAQAAPVAIPRPATIAKSNGVSVSLPNGTSPLNFHFSHATNIMEGNHAGQMSFITSPDLTINGTTLFAGMTDANKHGGPWWSATGVLLPTPVYDTTHTEDRISAPGSRNIRFAFRLPPAAQGITFQYKLSHCIGSSSNGAWLGKSQSNTGHTEAHMFTNTDGTRVVLAAFPSTLTKTDVQVGIASEKWKTAVSNSHPPIALNTNNGDQSFILSSAEQTAKGLVLTVTTNSTDDIRIVAINTQGKMLLPADIGDSSINGMEQITAHFSQPLSQIKEFRAETRPFHWIEFKDVALQPAQAIAKFSPTITPTEWQIPWTSSDIHSTWNPKTPTYYMQMHLAPGMSGTRPDPPVTGRLVSGPGKAGNFSVAVWKPGKSNILTVKFDYTPNQTDKARPDIIHLLTKSGAVAAIIRYSAE